MENSGKTKKQLIAELGELRQRLAGVEKPETKRKQAEEALRESKEKLQRMFEFATDGIVVTDLNGNIMELNEAAVRLRGSDSKEKLIGRSTFELIAEKDRVRTMETLKSALEDGQIRRNVELTFLTEDGREYLAEVSSALLRDAAGNPAGFIAIFRDITERKQAEEALRESEEKYRAFFETSRDAVFITSKDGRWIDFNDATVELLGYENSDELRKVRIPELYEKPEERERITQAIEQRGFAKDLAVNFRKKDGSIINILITAVVNKDESGNVIGYQGTFTDITGRKQAEEELRKSQEHAQFLANVLESSSQPFAVGYPDGRLRTFNTAYCELLDYSRGELHELKWDMELTPPEWREVVAKAAEEIIRNRQPQRFEKEYIRKDGSRVPVEVFATPIFDSKGDLEYFFSFFTDITERKQAEEALKESEAQYSALVKTSPDGIVMMQDGVVKFANTTSLELVGYRLEELIGVDFLNIVSPGNRKMVMKRFADRVAGKEVPSIYEITLIKKDGTTLPVEVNATLTNYEGRTAVLVFIRDITERKRAEEQTKQLQEYLQLQINRMPIGLIVWDTEFHVQSWNPAAEKIFGFTAEEALGKHPYDLIVPKEVQPHVDDIWRRLLAGDMTAYSVNENITKDGRTLICDWSNTPLRKSDGTVVGVLSMVEDITERKRAEETLRESEGKYRSLVSNVKLGVFRNTPDPAGRFLEVNPAMEKITGYRRKELLQMNVTDLYVHPEERERVLEEVASGKGKAAREVQFKKKDGTEIVVLSRKVAVRDDAGNILYFDGIMEDITERKRVEERIVHLTNVLRAIRSINQLIAHEKDKGRLIQQSCNILVEARGYSIAWILLLDEDGNYISAAGSGSEKSFPILLEQMKRGEYPPCVREVLAQEPSFAACDDVKRQHIECVLTDCYMGGGVGFVNQLEYEGRVYGTVCVAVSPEMAQDEEEHELFRELATDVSFALASIELEEEHKWVGEKLREAEAFKELDRLRSELVANISHELRTPLASIKGFATTLLQPDVRWSEEEQRDFLQSIDQEADRLTRLISDLLDMSRLEVGALELEKGDYRISEILDSVSDRLASLTEHHQLEVIVPTELPAVFVDEMRIGQVLTNLVGNATKFSSKDSPITIEAQLAGDQVIISVTDRGQGIPPELLDRVFDRFYQTESIVTGRKSGTGLGLSICQGIIKAHGGRIWVESEVGKGSKFSLNLPVSQSEGQDG